MSVSLPAGGPLWARLLTVVFHPLVVPTHLFAFLLFGIQEFVPVDNTGRWLMLVAGFFFTCLAPATMTLLMLRLGVIKDRTLQDTRERVVPMALTAVIYVLGYQYFKEALNFNAFIGPMLLGTAVCIALIAIITPRWKISAHSAGLGGSLGFMWALLDHYSPAYFMYPIMAGIVALGFTMAARLIMQVHSIAQTIAGASLGFIICYLAIRYLG